MNPTKVAALALALSPVVQADEPALYYQTSDYATMVCSTAEQALVANAISHGYAFGNQSAHGKWLEEQQANKVCIAMAPGQRFLTSKATPVYMRSINDVRWVVQMLPPADTSRPIGWIPIDHIRFIPIPTL
jgi:hypothetical protein